MSIANHFAPPAGGVSPLGRTPVISVTALAGVPAFVRDAFGDPVHRAASKAAMLDIEAIEDQDCFIPHRTLAGYLDAVAHLGGEPEFGLLLAPCLSLARYGCWGRYILGAPTLGAALERARSTVAYHSKGDAVAVDVHGDRARISYASAAAGLAGYRHVASGSAGVIASLCRAYLPEGWRPLAIELDLPTPPRPQRFEEAFGCPVHFDAPRVAVWLAAECLQQRPAQRLPPQPLLTVHDLARARIECHRLRSATDVVAQQLWAQVLSGAVSIDSAACALATSVRTLQRELKREGTDFRSLANALRARRATELLSASDATVTQISAALGYAAPAHFARAFRKTTGRSPQEFRERELQQSSATPTAAPDRARSAMRPAGGPSRSGVR